MSKQDYRTKTTLEAFEELHDTIEVLGRTIAGEAKPSNRTLDILAKAGIDGKLTGADAVISLMSLTVGLLMSALFFFAKLADGYRPRDALGCGVDLMTVVLGVVVIRFLLDVLSVPLILSSIFELKSVIPEQAPEPTVVRDPIFVNRQLQEANILVGLPNGETIDNLLLIQYLETVRGQGGKVWSREEWCNSPADPKRPGRGKMSQEQWRGVKQFLEEMSLWRASTVEGIDQLIGDLGG